MTDLHPSPGGPATLPPRSAPDGASRVAESPAAGAREPGALLRGGTREVLARLADGDPLALRPRVARALLRRRLLVDASRAWWRALAAVARRAGRPRGGRSLERWLDQEVERALDTLSGDGPPGPLTEGEHRLALALGLEPERLPAALARFHALSFEVRDAFFRLCVEGRSLDELVHARGAAAHEEARRARLALATLLASARRTPAASDPVTAP